MKTIKSLSTSGIGIHQQSSLRKLGSTSASRTGDDEYQRTIGAGHCTQISYCDRAVYVMASASPGAAVCVCVRFRKNFEGCEKSRIQHLQIPRGLYAGLRKVFMGCLFRSLEAVLVFLGKGTIIETTSRAEGRGPCF